MQALLETIVEQAKPLYGRPAWSVWYLEKVKAIVHPEKSKIAERDGQSLCADVERAAKNTVDEVKGDLRDRLNKLQCGGTERLMETLCKIVVWSDLSDRPTIFWDDTGPKMVQQAFAVCEKRPDGKPLYLMKERLALEAAKDYFLTEPSKLVEKTLARHLEEHATDSGAFGKPAEYFLAWVSAN